MATVLVALSVLVRRVMAQESNLSVVDLAALRWQTLPEVAGMSAAVGVAEDVGRSLQAGGIDWRGPGAAYHMVDQSQPQEEEDQR
jgi:hypothetical protein